MKNIKQTISTQLMEKFTRIHNKTTELDRKMSLEIGKGLFLNASELDTIVSIGNHPRSNVTELSRINGVTKAAISKMVKKLVEKGFVEKKKMTGNKKEVLLDLTGSGESVIKMREEHHHHFFQMIEKHVSVFSVEQVDIIFNLLDILEKHLNDHLDE